MKVWKLIVSSVPLAMAASMVQAAPDPAEVQQILTKNACLACHAVENKLVGPAYREVAEKYAGDDNAATTVATHIRDGSSGIWGPVPMPPNPGISDEELTKVVDWILAGAPE
ncbi:MAG TPA: c-type cytochrome [Burkholderiaceae bacterium]|nr:c-type cytochrome [Burkholderiaceae bacterium]